jgi:N-carbamoylputrescine amidase
MRVAVVQMRSTGDVADNIRRACEWIDVAAARHGADLVVLPEFFNTLYFAQDRDLSRFALAEPERGPTITAVRERARRHGIDVVATLYEELELGLYYDTAFYVGGDGEIVFRYRKVHPAAVHSLEKVYFRYGTRFDTFERREWRVGIGICYDWAFPETARCLAVNGAELLIAPYATTRVNLFQEMLRTRAFENGCYLAAANKVGREGDWTFSGRSLIADPRGAILASVPDDEEGVIAAEVDREAVRTARIDFPGRRDRRPDLYGDLVREVDRP